MRDVNPLSKHVPNAKSRPRYLPRHLYASKGLWCLLVAPERFCGIIRDVREQLCCFLLWQERSIRASRAGGGRVLCEAARRRETGMFVRQIQASQLQLAQKKMLHIKFAPVFSTRFCQQGALCSGDTLGVDESRYSRSTLQTLPCSAVMEAWKVSSSIWE